MAAPIVVTPTVLLHCDAGAFSTSVVERSVPVKAPSEGDFYVAVTCINLPTDSFISVTMLGWDADSSVNAGKMLVPSSNMRLMWRLNWPADFQSELGFVYWQGPTPAPSGSYIEVALVPASAAADNPCFAQR